MSPSGARDPPHTVHPPSALPRGLHRRCASASARPRSPAPPGGPGGAAAHAQLFPVEVFILFWLQELSGPPTKDTARALQLSRLWGARPVGGISSGHQRCFLLSPVPVSGRSVLSPWAESCMFMAPGCPGVGAQEWGHLCFWKLPCPAGRCCPCPVGIPSAPGWPVPRGPG